jgi:hypothetical protein
MQVLLARPQNLRIPRWDGSRLLRIDFDAPDDSLTQVSWDEFFASFDEQL